MEGYQRRSFDGLFQQYCTCENYSNTGEPCSGREQKKISKGTELPFFCPRLFSLCSNTSANGTSFNFTIVLAILK